MLQLSSVEFSSQSVAVAVAYPRGEIPKQYPTPKEIGDGRKHARSAIILAKQETDGTEEADDVTRMSVKYRPCCQRQKVSGCLLGWHQDGEHRHGVRDSSTGLETGEELKKDVLDWLGRSCSLLRRCYYSWFGACQA